MAIKFIYAGYAKSGSQSIATAFRMLGYNVFDFEESCTVLMEDWMRFFDPHSTDHERSAVLKKLLDGADVVIAFPFYFFWKEILDLSPGAKVIFWERPVEDVYSSLCKQNAVDQQDAGLIRDDNWLVTVFNRVFIPYKIKFDKFSRLSMPFISGPYAGAFNPPSELFLRRSYRQHCADIRMNCPKDKLFILETVDCGWKTFCAITGDSVPEGDIPWPHKNKKKHQNAKELVIREQFRNRMFVCYYALILAIVSIATLAVYIIKRVNDQ